MSYKWYGGQVKREIRKEEVDRLWASGYIVEENAKRICTNVGAVDTGRLRASHKTAVDASKLSAQVIAGGEVNETEVTTKRGIARAGTPVDYAVYVFMGHRTRSGTTVAARPVLRPALQVSLKRIRKVWGI